MQAAASWPNPTVGVLDVLNARSRDKVSQECGERQQRLGHLTDQRAPSRIDLSTFPISPGAVSPVSQEPHHPFLTLTNNTTSYDHSIVNVALESIPASRYESRRKTCPRGQPVSPPPPSSSPLPRLHPHPSLVTRETSRSSSGPVYSLLLWVLANHLYQWIELCS